MRLVACLLVLSGASGCAAVIETRSVTNRIGEQRLPFSRRMNESLDVRTSLDGVMETILIQRVATCERGTRVEGTESVHVHRELEDSSIRSYPVLITTLVGLTGLIAGAVGIVEPGFYLCGPDSGSSCSTQPDGTVGNSGMTAGTAREISGAVMGVGALAMIPLIVNVARTRDSDESRPFSEEEGVISGEPCTSLPVVTGVVALRAPMDPERQTFRLPPLDAQGRTVVDLTALLPSRAFAGQQPWLVVELLVDREVVKTIDLGPVRSIMADRAWHDARATGLPERFADFRSSFPQDARVAQIADTLARIHAEAEIVAQDRVRRPQWIAAGMDSTRLHNIIDEQRHDAYEVASICRLASMETSLDALRAGGVACNAAVAGLSPMLERVAADVAGVADQLRAQVARGVVDGENEARLAAEQAVAAEAAARERSRHHAHAAGVAAVHRARDIIAGCRHGGDTGVGAARRAYEALTEARATTNPATLRHLVIEVAAACHATPTQVGVPSP